MTLRREHPRQVRVAWAIEGCDFNDMVLEAEGSELARQRYRGAQRTQSDRDLSHLP